MKLRSNDTYEGEVRGARLPLEPGRYIYKVSNKRCTCAMISLPKTYALTLLYPN